MMNKWTGALIVFFLLTVSILRCVFVTSPILDYTVLRNTFKLYNSSNQHHWKVDEAPDSIQFLRNDSLVVSTDSLVSGSLTLWNFSVEELQSLQTWKYMNQLADQTQGLPNAIEAVKEGAAAWKILMESVQEKKQNSAANGSTQGIIKGRQCPYSIRKMNSSEFNEKGFKLKIPCGLVQGSSITVIGTPGGLLGNFQIELTGTTIPGEIDPPIILHYNVRLNGDKVTEDSVIVQNTYTATQGWATEERCPSDPKNNDKVDDLERCSKVVGKDERGRSLSGEHSNGSRESAKAKERSYFPFKQGYLAIATLRVGDDGIQMTVDGKHITSFAYRESLEPWLVSELRISGDIKVISVLASGLPTSEDLDHVIDLEILKAPSFPVHKNLDLFVGIFSSANNFKQRMAVRRTWMQYDAVRSGDVATRFFVGLHKNQMVNEELWNEAQTYGDIQLMPFVDYYSVITWKTIAICIYGTNVVSAKYIMKTDDDSFVRLDELLTSLKATKKTGGLLYGLINSDSKPHRSTDSKWYISPEEWPDDTYPPWAHGPGYVVSRDIAKAVFKKHKQNRLRMFKLEDVAMGIWITEMKKKGMEVSYVKEERIYNDGCQSGYVVAHYQGPRDMLCLWQKLRETHLPTCCGEGSFLWRSGRLDDRDTAELLVAVMNSEEEMATRRRTMMATLTHPIAVVVEMKLQQQQQLRNEFFPSLLSSSFFNFFFIEERNLFSLRFEY